MSKRRVGFLSLVCSVGCVILLLCLTGCGDPIPEDALLITTFEAQQDDFETLVAMMREDVARTSLHKVDRAYVQYDQSENDAEISEERVQAYRDLFARLDVLSITYYNRKEESFLITAFARGWSPEGGIYKGYEYYPDGLPPRRAEDVVDSLDYEPQTYEPGTWLYREMEGNWYLWFLY